MYIYSAPVFIYLLTHFIYLFYSVINMLWIKLNLHWNQTVHLNEHSVIRKIRPGVLKTSSLMYLFSSLNLQIWIGNYNPQL